MPLDPAGDGMAPLCADLTAEHDALDVLVAGLDEDGWRTPTPATGWDVRDQIGHLWFFDGTATLAATDPDAFAASTKRMYDGFAAGGPDPTLSEARAMSGTELLATWRSRRHLLIEALAALDPSARLPWYGPPMAARSFASARLMETWAHGQDVADALGAVRAPTDRLRHIAHIGVRARPYSYRTRGQEPPPAEIRVELRGPSGDAWTWGPEGVPDVVRGDALAFCLLVTQRRHLDDVDLEVEGDAAREWAGIAQAFAGPPGEGRQPGQFG